MCKNNKKRNHKLYHLLLIRNLLLMMMSSFSLISLPRILSTKKAMAGEKVKNK